MIKNYLHVAKVEANDDSSHTDGKKEGRIKISIAYKTEGFDPSHLPWVRPFELGTGGNGSYGKSNIPEVGSYVWVFFYDTKHLKQGFYLANVNFADINPHTFFNDTIKSKVTSAGAYPNVKWQSYKNQITTFVDTSTDNPEIGFYHSAGTYCLVDKDGKIKISVVDSKATIEIDKTGKIDITAGGDITIDSGSNDMELKGNNINVTPTTLCKLDAGTQLVNNFPACLFTNAVHSTATKVKA